MLTDTTIRAVDSIANVSLKGRRVNGLFRLLENPEVLWKQAYANIYPNRGAITRGVGNNTLDGFSEERVKNLIKMLQMGSYRCTPVRRTYIPKANGKRRPLGIPTGNDKLVQEVVRILLERIYEPIFSDNSHGFRKGRSCHTALKQVKCVWTGVKWIIEVDIKSFFDSINHEKMVELLEKKVDDRKVVRLIKMMLKAGYMEDWRYNRTFSGTPQGGVISPILANIYLHELDMFMKELTVSFDMGNERKPNPEYQQLARKMDHILRRYHRLQRGWKKGTPPENAREVCLQDRKRVAGQMRKLPSKDPLDAEFKRLRYVRYADDFIIGIIGSRKDAEMVLEKVITFLKEELHLEVAENKTCIQHAKDGVRFLGYDIRSYSSDRPTKKIVRGKTVIARSLSGDMQLHVPLEKMVKFCRDKGYGNYETFRANSRKGLLLRSDVEIVNVFNAEMRGLANYYSLATGYKTAMSKLIGMAQYSCFATLAHKHKTRTPRITRKMRQPDGSYALREIINGEPKLFRLFRLADHVRPAVNTPGVDTPKDTYWLTLSKTELVQRLNANTCEYCGKAGGYTEVHHVHGLKDVKDKKTLWQEIMSKMRRKTIVLCFECHQELHAGNLPNWRAKTK